MGLHSKVWALAGGSPSSRSLVAKGEHGCVQERVVMPGSRGRRKGRCLTTTGARGVVVHVDLWCGLTTRAG